MIIVSSLLTICIYLPSEVHSCYFSSWSIINSSSPCNMHVWQNLWDVVRTLDLFEFAFCRSIASYLTNAVYIYIRVSTRILLSYVPTATSRSTSSFVCSFLSLFAYRASFALYMFYIRLLVQYLLPYILLFMKFWC